VQHELAGNELVLCGLDEQESVATELKEPGYVTVQDKLDVTNR
jgi:hypothetical protein